MKILIQSCYSYAPHLETELELAFDYIQNGHDVYFLLGNDVFEYSFANPLNRKLISWQGESRIKNGITLLKEISGANKARVHSLIYPQMDVRFPEIPVFKDLSELKKYEYKGIDVGLAAASSLISFVRDHKMDTFENKELIERAIRTAIFVFETGQKILDEVNPDKVIIFNGRFVENRPLLRLCEIKGIDYYTHERAGKLDRYLFRENAIPHSIESAFKEINDLWDSAENDREEIGKRFFLDRQKGLEQSWYSFTDKQEKGLLPAAWDERKSNIVIYNSSMDEYEGITGFDNPIYENDNDGIERICKGLLETSDTQVFVRIHPNLKNLNNSQIRQLEELDARYPNLHLIRAEEVVDSYALLKAADKVLVFTSTMGVEAAFWNKVVILAGRSFAEGLSCFHKPKSHKETIELLLNKDLPTLDKADSLKYGYWQLSYGRPFKYYQPESVTSGSFMGKYIKSGYLYNLLNEVATNIHILKKQLKSA